MIRIIIDRMTSRRDENTCAMLFTACRTIFDFRLYAVV